VPGAQRLATQPSPDGWGIIRRPALLDEAISLEIGGSRTATKLQVQLLTEISTWFWNWKREKPSNSPRE
jgi:hypothetical protein